MATPVNVYDITPGETFEQRWDVSGLASGETVVGAVLEIRFRDGRVALPVKAVNGVSSDDGVVGAAYATFRLKSSETLALHPREPYYIFSVQVTTSTGRKLFAVPVGRIMPTQVYGVPVVKLGVVHSPNQGQMQATVVGEK